MVTDSRHPGQQVSNRSPRDAHVARDAAMQRNDIRIFTMNILGPLGGIRIPSATEAREQSKFQMIVRVDKTGENEIAREIEPRYLRSRTVELPDHALTSCDSSGYGVA